MDAPKTEEDLTAAVKLGEGFEYDGKPGYKFNFGEFTLCYRGYLPGIKELYDIGPHFAGNHYFTVWANEKNSEGRRDITDFSWGIGTGELSPSDFSINGKRYSFHPYSIGGKPARIELFESTDSAA